MKVLVTGASGFVGGHVVAALAKRRDVEIIATSRRVIEGRDLPASAHHVPFDLAAAGPGDYARLGSPDVLIHLAWGGLPNYLSLHHFERELPVHYNFLRTMVDEGLPAMLVTGTCYEYGMVEGELAEEAIPAPANPYAFAKFALQRQLTFLRDHITFELTWARLFYMFGEGQSERSLYPQLKQAAEVGDARFPLSGGKQIRDYLPVGDVADAITRLAVDLRDTGIVNVCSGAPVSISALVDRWIAENGWSIQPDYGKYPYPVHEPMNFWGAVRKARSLGVGQSIAAD